MVSVIDTLHSDIIHDAQYDVTGTRLATCSSDATVRVFEVSTTAAAGGEQKEHHQHVVTLDGHDGPVWQVAWAHPKFGVLLASCSYDNKLIVWKEVATQSAVGKKWIASYEFEFGSSVNSCLWAPHELGQILACCSSDGSFAIFTFTDGSPNPEVKRIQDAHSGGVNAISWAPAIHPGALLDDSLADMRSWQKKVVTGGNDKKVRIWACREEEWVQDGHPLEFHEDWVRDVAWAPSIGLPSSTIASCSQDGRVVIWRASASTAAGGCLDRYQPHLLNQFSDVVWHVSWSFTGNVLAVSGGDNEVTLWKESEDRRWEKISDVNKSSRPA